MVSAESLADLRRDLGILLVQIESLQSEQITTTQPVSIVGATTLDQIAAIETELRRLTAKVEHLEFRIENVVQRGTKRVSDLEFRICDLEDTCAVTDLGSTLPIGDVLTTANETAPIQGVIMTITEQREFDEAKEVLERGDPATAVQMFQDFTRSYPGGPITQEAFYLQGQAELELEDYKDAARSFLNSYSEDSESTLAADALFQLGLAFHKIGRVKESCLTLSEVSFRFPTSAASSAAVGAVEELECA